MGPGTMGRRGMMGGGMMGAGAMGPPMMMRMIFALMDSDGDGTIELAEFQAAHERIFKATKMAGLLRKRCERSCGGPG
jgi:hypothetical protein